MTEPHATALLFVECQRGVVGDLSVQDPDFRTWWGGQLVSSASYGVKRYRHPVVGDLTLDCDTWNCPDGSDQRLMVLTAEPGSPSHEALRILASWAASEAASGAAEPGVIRAD